jgi:hypothetical protein
MPRPRLPLLAGAVAFVLVAGLVIARGGLRPAPQPAASVPANAPLPPWTGAAPAVPPQPVSGELTLADFRLIVPKGWLRRADLEDPGPGTKLFLAGPTVGKGQIYIGIDVYPLPQGMTLADFIKRYSAQWVGLGVIADKPATLCGQPARMLSMSDVSVDKLFLVAVMRDRGLAVGMFGPTGQAQLNVKAFKEVVDTLQCYE